MSITIGLGTGVKWAQVTSEELPREIKKRLGGGAKNPHATAFALAKRLILGQASPENTKRIARAIPSVSKRTSVQRAVEHAIKMFPPMKRSMVPLPKPSAVGGPERLIAVGTRPHLIVDEGNYRRHLGLWNNEKPELSGRGVLIGALLMRQYCETLEGKINTFEIVDLRSEQIFCFTEDQLDEEPSKLIRFILNAETELKKLLAP